MKALMIMALVTVGLTGCGWFERYSATITGDPSKICVDGVTYLQFTSGVTVQVDPQGRPVACR